jgi:2,3-bisphosphoglycerate-independent phosphoglycerate mutase
VHSHITHLKALCDSLQQRAEVPVFVHAFTDGRDVDPHSGLGFISDLAEYLTNTDVKLASITGRYYAMDRDKRWERTKLAYDALVNGSGTDTTDMVGAVKASYDAGITDEFIKPIIHVDAAGTPLGKMQDGDLMIFFNFRTDRPRQLVTVLSQQDMPDFGMKTLDLDVVTMTSYDHTYRDVEILFEQDDLMQTLGEVLSTAGKTQLRIAETEKYPHVTYFFSGGREVPFPGEERRMVPSPKVATYDLQPEMSAIEVTDVAIAFLNTHKPDFICLNYANPDMVGHTGVFDAGIRAVETVDTCLGRLLEAGLAQGYGAIIIADHGNADMMINPDGSPNTAHTTNPVPVIYVSAHNSAQIHDGILADIAPTILALLGVIKPAIMTRQNLLEAD